MEIDIKKVLNESRQLTVSLDSPDGTSEVYIYYVDTPGICCKVLEDESVEVVDFDFIPEYILAAASTLLES